MRIPEMGQLGGLSPQGSIAVGVLVGLISTSLQAIGLTLQRKSHILEDEKHPFDVRRPPYKRRRWQVGMSMFVLANIVGSTIQITTLPLPVLSTLQASGLVFNTIFATLILGESFTRYSLIGTVLVCIGAVMIATFGAIGEPAHTLDQLLGLLARPPFIKWMAGTGVIVALTLLSIRVLKVLSTPSKTRNLLWRYRLSPAIHYHSPRSKVIRGMLYGSVSGILSAHSLLVAKSAVELLVRTLVYRVNQFNRWQSWVILIGLVALALTQLYYMHRGLKLCSTSILYPFVFCIYNIIAILDGLIYFHQASKLSALHAGLIALGTVVLLSGVLCLSWRLEDIPTTQAIGHPPAPLTPGLGLLDEDRSSSEYLYADDEESQRAGERQPLLPHTPRETTSPTQKYTLPRLSPTHRRSTNASIDTAEIWAELADDDEDVADIRDSVVLPPPSPLSPVRRFSRRHRRTISIPSDSNPSSKRAHTSSTSNDDQLSPLSPTPGAGPIRHDGAGAAGAHFKPSRRKLYPQLQLQGGTSDNTNIPGWRRTSTPLVFAESSPVSRGQRDVSAMADGSNHEATRTQRSADARDGEQRYGEQGRWRVWETGRQWLRGWTGKRDKR